MNNTNTINAAEQIETPLAELLRRIDVHSSFGNRDTVSLLIQCRQRIEAMQDVLQRCVEDGDRQIKADAPGVAPAWYDDAVLAIR